MKTCQQCGTEMPDDAPEGLCPRCLISAAVKPNDLSSEPTRIEPESGAAANVAAGSTPQIPDIGDAAEVARRLPQFEILTLLGRGGMGVVYKARQINLDRIVALKILPPADALSPDFVERFRREARSLAKLSHPNIVNVHDFGETGGLYYFVMEFVDGVNLREMIRTGKMRPEEALAVVPKICDALQFAHEEGVVHRDVKPENILMDKRGRVKIADFGLAKLLRREQSDHTLTMTGMTLGTPRYMAPEQLDKPESVDHRADIYSLGVVFYEMLTGEVPMGRFAPPSEKVRIDVRLDEIVLHALERDADRRYQHVSEVRDDVEKVTSKPQVAPQPSPIPSAPAPEHPLAAGMRFAMTPQPDYLRHVGKLMMIFTGIWMVVNFAVMFLVPEKNERAHVITMGVGLLGVPIGFLILSLRWAVNRRRQSAIPTPGESETPAPQSPNEEEDAEAEHSVFAAWGGRIIALAAVLLAFFNPWGVKAWYFFAAGCAIFGVLSSFGIGRRGTSEKGEPRLSRLALWGAIWAVVGIPTGIILALAIHDSAGVAKFSGILHLPTPLFALIPISAAVGVTFLGGIAIAHIKRSNGKLYGLPLAAFDCLLFPVLALGSAAFGFMHLVQIALWTKVHTGYEYKADQLINVIAPNPANRPDEMFLILDTLVALVVCFYIGFVAWRKIAGTPDPLAKETKPTTESNEPRLSRLALWGAIWAAVGLLATIPLVIGYIVNKTPSGVTRPPDWFLNLTVVLGIVIASAVFGATILGAVAVAQIKRSGGKFYGLRLAAAAALFFPLLAVFAVTVLVSVEIFFALTGISLPKLHGISGIVWTALPGLIASLIVGVFAWRKIVRPPAEPKSSANEIKLGAENTTDKPQPGFLRHVVVPMLILLVLCSAVGTLSIAMFEKQDDTVLKMCWRVGSIVVPVAAALLLVRWVRLRGIAGSIGRFAWRFLGPRSWMWPVATLLLVPAANHLPRPGDLPMPREASEIFQPITLVTPEGSSFRFLALEEWHKFTPVFAVTLMTTARQEVTLTPGWDAGRVMRGFYHRNARWSYELTATRFGNWKSPEDGPIEIAPAARTKLRPLVVAELNRRAFGRGRVLEDMLDNGRSEESSVCWQNFIVLLAWLSLPLAALALLLRLWSALSRKE